MNKIIVLFFLFVFLGSCAEKKTEDITIHTFQTETGWGYDILIKNKVYVHQPVIPAIPGKNGFKNENDARKTAVLVSKKIAENIMPPSVTIRELDSIGVLPENY